MPQMSLKTTKYILVPFFLCSFLCFRFFPPPPFLPCSLPFPTSFSLPLQTCVQAVEALSAGQHVSEEDLVLLGQLPHSTHDHRHLFTLIRSFLLPMKSYPVVTLLTLQEPEQQQASLEQLFERAETENSAEVCYVGTANGCIQDVVCCLGCCLLCTILS